MTKNNQALDTLIYDCHCLVSKYINHSLNVDISDKYSRANLIKTYKITTSSKYLILWYKIYIAGQDRIILLPFSYHRLRMQYHLYLSGARSNPDNCVLLLPLYFQIDIYLTNNLFVSEWWQEDWGKYYFWMGKKGNLWWHFLICHASDG